MAVDYRDAPPFRRLVRYSDQARQIAIPSGVIMACTVDGASSRLRSIFLGRGNGGEGGVLWLSLVVLARWWMAWRWLVWIGHVRGGI
jgi:hypothetical protein